MRDKHADDGLGRGDGSSGPIVPFIGRGAVPRNDPPDLPALVTRYWTLVRQCDTEIARQETVTSAVANRVSLLMQRLSMQLPAGSDGGGAHPTASGSLPMFAAARAALDKSAFARRSAVGRVIGTGRNARPAALFAQEASDHDLAEIEATETRIRHLQSRIAEAETAILDACPVSRTDAIAKLRFVSLIVRDGGEVEIDHFAYIVEECAEVLETLR